jgi:hypothetical protein
MRVRGAGASRSIGLPTFTSFDYRGHEATAASAAMATAGRQRAARAGGGGRNAAGGV